MRVVIVGAKDRQSAQDRTDVLTLLGLLEKKYGSFMVVTATAYTGIGQIVKEECARKVEGAYRFPFCEIDAHVYASDLPPNDMIQIYTGRNAALYEIGDLYFSFPNARKRSVTDELIKDRVIPSGRPYRIFNVGDAINIDTIPGLQ